MIMMKRTPLLNTLSLTLSVLVSLSSSLGATSFEDEEKKEKDLEPLNFDEFFAAELKSKYIHDGRVAEVRR